SLSEGWAAFACRRRRESDDAARALIIADHPYVGFPSAFPVPRLRVFRRIPSGATLRALNSEFEAVELPSIALRWVGPLLANAWFENCDRLLRVACGRPGHGEVSGARRLRAGVDGAGCNPSPAHP